MRCEAVAKSMTQRRIRIIRNGYSEVLTVDAVYFLNTCGCCDEAFETNDHRSAYKDDIHANRMYRIRRIIRESHTPAPRASRHR